MLNWNSLTWVDHSNSRRVNNCRVLMKFTMREARAGHGPGLHCQSRRESRQISGVQAGHMMMIVLSLVWGPHHSCPDIRVGISGPRQQVREREWHQSWSGSWHLVTGVTREIRDPHPTPGPITHDCDLHPGIDMRHQESRGMKMHRRRCVHLNTSMWTYLEMSLDTADYGASNG